MKGKTLILTSAFMAATLLSGCSLLGFGGDPEEAKAQPAQAVATPDPTPPPPPPPAKPMTEKERKKAAAEEKKRIAEEKKRAAAEEKKRVAEEKKRIAAEKKQAELDRKAGKPAKLDPQDVVQAKLDAFAKTHVSRANETLRPNKENIAVRRDGAQFMAWYSEVDVVTLKTELYPSNTIGCQYVGHVVYIENIIASYGKTEKEARSGVFKQIKSKRVRELTRYDRGAWQY